MQAQPNDFGLRVERASVLVDLGKDEDALAELDKAAASAPEDLRALKLRSGIYFEKKRYDDAVPVLQKAASLAPQDPDIPVRLGLVFLEKKDYPNAVRSLSAALKMVCFECDRRYSMTSLEAATKPPVLASDFDRLPQMTSTRSFSLK